MAEQLTCPICGQYIRYDAHDGIALYICGHVIHGDCYYDLHHQSSLCFVCGAWSWKILFQ